MPMRPFWTISGLRPDGLLTAQRHADIRERLQPQILHVGGLLEDRRTGRSGRRMPLPLTIQLSVFSLVLPGDQ
jgi:hypothetical protein